MLLYGIVEVGEVYAHDDTDFGARLLGTFVSRSKSRRDRILGKWREAYPERDLRPFTLPDAPARAGG